MTRYHVRASLATPYMSPETVAQFLQDAQSAPNLEGSVTPSIGFGAWGVEPGVTINTVTDDYRGVQLVIRALLSANDQECAYVEFSYTHTDLFMFMQAQEWRVDDRYPQGIRVGVIQGNNRDPDELPPETYQSYPDGASFAVTD